MQTALDAAGACRVYYGDEEDDEEEDKGPVPKHVYRHGTKRARYFGDRALEICTDF